MRTPWLKTSIFTLITLASIFGYVSFAQRYFAFPDPVQETLTLLTTSDPAVAHTTHEGEALADQITIPTKGNGAKTAIQKVLFSPDDTIRKTLIALIDSERERISIAIFSLTDQLIAKSLIAAHKRGVAIELIADRKNAANQWSKVHTLARAGIPVYLYPITPDDEHYSIMHHKFALFACTLDQRTILLTGSYNFTNSASDSNQENVIIIENPSVSARYRTHFQRLKTRAKLTEAEGIRPRRRKRIV